MLYYLLAINAGIVLYKYKEILKQKCMIFTGNMIYNSIYCFSCCEMIIKRRLMPHYNYMLEKYYTKNNNMEDDVEFIYDGDVIYKTSRGILSLNNTPKKFDFIIYSDNNKTIKNKKIKKRIMQRVITDTENIDFIETKYKFMLIECYRNSDCNNPTKIDLETDDINYYMVDNIISLPLILYLLKTKNIDVKNEDITIKILDHNVNQVTLSYESFKSIILQNNKYDMIF